MLMPESRESKLKGREGLRPRLSPKSARLMRMKLLRKQGRKLNLPTQLKRPKRRHLQLKNGTKMWASRDRSSSSLRRSQSLKMRKSRLRRLIVSTAACPKPLLCAKMLSFRWSTVAKRSRKGEISEGEHLCKTLKK